MILVVGEHFKFRRFWGWGSQEGFNLNHDLLVVIDPLLR
jgi:hypothetical protein